MRKYLAFDIEIYKPIPDGATDWKIHRPLGISCAATATTLSVHQWHNNDMAQPMTQSYAASLVRYLCAWVADGYTLLTWNGASFDLDILAEESGLHAECVELALNHCDMMFQILCEKGHPLGLNTAALGMGLQGKTEGVDGAQAPQLWAEGRYEEVLAYVSQDVKCTLDIALAVEKYQRLIWIAKSGRRNLLSVPLWLTVRECLDLPEPDTSWMSHPMKRADMVAWLKLETAQNV